MKSFVKTLTDAEIQSTAPISATIISLRGSGSYVVRDNLGRTYVVLGQMGFRKAQKVVVINKQIVSAGNQSFGMSVVNV